MIGQILGFLRERLDDYLRAEMGDGPDAPTADKVVFIAGDQLDPISFHDEAVSELLINIEEERVLRAADPYVRVQADGKPQRKQPDLRLVLYVLFVARFQQYALAWDHLAKIIECLQTNRTYDRANHPDLPAGVDKLTLELVTQTFGEQSDVWNMLKTTYHPSALYRVRLVVLHDTSPVLRDQITEPVVVDVHQAS